MRVLKSLWKTTTVKTIAVIAVLVLAWDIFLTFQAPGKISSELAAASQSSTSLRIAITLDFPPERFHTLELQDYGHVMRVQDNTLFLRSVRPESVQQIAKIYWVDRVELFEEGAK